MYFNNCGNSSINKTFIIEPIELTGGTPVISACTVVYTNLIESCSGNTSISLGTNNINFNGGNVMGVNGLSANTITATDLYSGTTNILDLIISYDTFITGGTITYINSDGTLTLTKNNGVDEIITGFTDVSTTSATINDTGLITFTKNDGSTYDVSLSGTDLNDTFVTGFTYDNNNNFIISQTDGQPDLTVNINTVTGLTVNGDLDVINILSGNTNIDELFLNVDEFNIYSGNVNTVLTGKTDNTDFDTHTGDTTIHYTKGDILLSELGSSAHTHSLSEITDFATYSGNVDTLIGTKLDTSKFNSYTASTFDVFVTGGTFTDTSSTLTLTNNTGGTFDVSGFTSVPDLTSTGNTIDIIVDGLTTNIEVDVNQLELTENFIWVGDVNDNPVEYALSAISTEFRVEDTLITTGDVLTTISTYTGLTTDTSRFMVNYLTAHKDGTDFGFFKRTLALNNVSGVVTVEMVTYDFDEQSVGGLGPNDIIYTAFGGTVLVQVMGEVATTYDWVSTWDIVNGGNIINTIPSVSDNITPIYTTADRPNGREGLTIIDSDLGYVIYFFNGGWINSVGDSE